MESSALIRIFIFCATTSLTLAQFNPFMYGGDFGEDWLEMYGFNDGGAGQYLTYNQLKTRLDNLETNIRTGAHGGCESGVVGPFSATQRTGGITFRGNFLTPPSISLALSDLTTANAGVVSSFNIRPTQVTTTGATVIFTDGINNVASAFVSYMACPSNSSPQVPQNTGTG